MVAVDLSSAEVAEILELFKRVREVSDASDRKLNQMRAERKLVELRAEAAEAEAAELRKKLDDAKNAYEWLRREHNSSRNGWTLCQIESTKKGNELDAANAELERWRLQATDTDQAGKQHEAPTTGLTFPYATKELEAMRAAAAKHWEGYTTDKRQPTQKEIGLDIGEMLGLPRQASGDPARKAIILAAAIKPSDLPDA